MKKLFLSIFLSFAIILYSIPCVAYASMATTSNAQLNNDEEWIGDDDEFVATSSDADFDIKLDSLMTFSNVPMLMSAGVDDFNDYFVPYAQVCDASGKWVANVRGRRDTLYDTSSRVFFYWPERTDGTKYYSVMYHIPKAALPSAGTYGVEWSFHQATIGLDWINAASNVIAYKSGVAESSSWLDISYTTDYTTYCRGNVQIGYNTSVIDCMSLFTPVTDLDICVSRSNAFKFTFEKHSDQAVNTSPEISAGTTTTQDVIADSSQQVAQNTADMSDTLKEIVGTISNQLAALWDQMFNLMHVPQLVNDDKNTDRLINSGQENTEQVTGAIEEHGNFIIDGLKSLFIPSDEFFKSYFDDLYGWFSDRFGFLSFPIDLLVKFSDLILSSDVADCIITLPSFEIMGEQLLQEQSFNLTDFLEENFMVVLTALRMGTSIMLIMAFVNLCGDKWDEVMKN